MASGHSSLPTGVVTFLITDIEGSTRAFQRLGDDYPLLLAEHHRVVHAAVDRNGGVVVKDSGDGFVVAFGDAAAACAAAVDAQVALGAFTWPAGERLRVRMGLHSGEATPVAGDYVALALHQAARIAAAGHGDQILVSETTAGLAAARMPIEVTAREIGAHWLRDFEAPAALFQLCHPSLPATFPRLRVPTAASPGLPAGRTTFVGRERELETLRELLGRSALVTVTALGGTGKTRLAVRVAGEMEDAFPDGVWLVDLGALPRTGAVPSAVATTLGLAETPGEPIEETLLAHLRTRCTLLVLDAAEQVRDEARRLVQAITAGCPGVTVLVTSRLPLATAGEVVWNLPPMALPPAGARIDPGAILSSDSARLFVERAATARVGFAATAANASAISRICQRVDGIPLAIELAAARIKVLTPEKLADRLEASLAVLDTTPQDGDAQLRTVAATIDWSWRMLAADEQAIFRRLSIFANGAGLEAIEEVCTGDDVAPPAVLDVLARLVDKSLVVYAEPGGEPRYRMLDAVREYASERLRDAGEAEEMTARFVQWCGKFTAAVAAADESPTYKLWLERADVEIDNVRAALATAHAADDTAALTLLSASISAYLPFRGRFDEARRWLTTAVESQRRRGQCHVSLWCRSAVLEASVGKLAAAEELYREAIANTTEDDGWRSSAQLGLCSLAMERGDWADATDLARAALEQTRRLGHRVDEMNALGHLGGIAWMTGELDDARERFEVLHAMCVDLGDERRAANGLLNLVGVALDQDDTEKGLPLAESLVAACREFSEPDTLGSALQYLGTFLLRLGRSDEALLALSEAVAIFREHGLPRYIALGLAPYARAMAATGEPAAAFAACSEGLRLCAETDDHLPVADLLRALADLWADSNGAVALELLDSAAACEERSGWQDAVARALALPAPAS